VYVLILSIKPYFFGLSRLFNEIVEGNNYFIYPLIVLFNVEHEEFPQISDLLTCCALGKLWEST